MSTGKLLPPGRGRARALAGAATIAAVIAGSGSSDLFAQVLYWTAVNDDLKYAIHRSDPGGSDVIDVVPGIQDSLGGLAIDPDAGSLYWVEKGAAGSRIVRAGLDGTGLEPVHSTEDFLSQIAIDPERKMVYFTAGGDASRAGIWRLDLLGGEAKRLIPGDVYDLAVDGAGGKIYWVAQGQPGIWGTDIWRAGLDGSDPEPIIHHRFEHHTTGITVDPREGKIYWATLDYIDMNSQVVARANLDGSEVEPLTIANPGLDDWPVFLGLDRPNRRLYWVNGEDGVFYRVSTGGGEAEPLFEDAGPYGPFGLAVLEAEVGQPRFRRGDANADGFTDLGDAIGILVFLYLDATAVPCQQAGDTNDDGALDISDAVYVLDFLFLGGEAMEPPVETCGIDPTGHSLPCDSFPGCQ